jgi:KUP system potassium uptake protein
MTTQSISTQTSSANTHQKLKSQGTAALTLGALGVVYGDIGTSPLYTFQGIFSSSTGVPLDAPHITGAVSAIVWALMLVVTLKYVVLILRADNRGEGGVLALSALAAQSTQKIPHLGSALLLLGLFCATHFYGDSVITPAISVLGAMEGLTVVTPTLTPFVVPITLGILVGLFLVQRKGTGAVGKVLSLIHI